MKADIVPLSSLETDGRNANKGTERGRYALERSLEKLGAGRSILLDKNGKIIAGNKTAETAGEMGIEDVVIVRTTGDKLVAVMREDLDLDEVNGRARELAYADNRVGQLDLEFDPAVIAFDLEAGLDLSDFWNQEELTLLTADIGGGAGETADAEPQTSRADELREEWGTELGQLWRLESRTAGQAHYLICGDCTDKATVERAMMGDKADCVFTSPPYAVGVDYGSYDDTIGNLRAMLPKLVHLWLDAICDGGFAVVNFGDIIPGREMAGADEPCEYPMALEYWPVFRSGGWLLWSRRIWCKPNPRVQSPWCIQSNRAASDWEHLWTWKKSGQPIIKRVDGELRSALGWIDTSLMHGVDEGKNVHGAGMATGIAEWMINTHSRPRMPVHEPFSGSGTTLIAAENLSRQCRAIEISPAYVAVALQRYADAFGLAPELVQ